MKSRHTCRACNERKTFALYLDTKTGEYLPEQYGKCNRADKCGYHLSPYHDGYSQTMWEQEKGNRSEFLNNWKTTNLQPHAKPISFISFEIFKQNLKSYKQNNFVKFLIDLFGNEIAAGLISKYFIGTSKHWPGATIFWQIDVTGKIRSGKIMLYSLTTGKRVKEPFSHFTWVHSAIKQPEFQLKQCFYGEHLLKGNKKPVAIVESEKTAIIASVYFPQFIWIAAGSLNGLNVEKCEVLKDRDVVLYSDLSKPKPDKPTAFEVWTIKAKELSNIGRFIVNDLLECKADEAQRIEGSDLADYLIKFDYKKFIEAENAPVLKTEDINFLKGTTETGKEFDNLIIAWVKTKQGENYELLFSREGNYLPFGEQKEIVKELEMYFNKVFKPIMFDGDSYYCNTF